MWISAMIVLLLNAYNKYNLFLQIRGAKTLQMLINQVRAVDTAVVNHDN